MTKKAVKRPVKCPTCGALNQKEDTVKLGNRYYCPYCAEARGNGELSDWDILFQYICWLYQIPTLTGQMFKQIKDFRDNWGYTDLGMYHTLRYYHEILDKPVKEDAGIGIIPYYYDRARAHMTQKYEIGEKLQNFQHQEEVVYVTTIQAEKWKKKQPLDFSTVDWGDTHED